MGKRDKYGWASGFRAGCPVRRRRRGAGFDWRSALKFQCCVVMADFPDILEAALRARLGSLGVTAADVEERFVRGAGAGGQKIKMFKSIPTVSRNR